MASDAKLKLYKKHSRLERPSTRDEPEVVQCLERMQPLWQAATHARSLSTATVPVSVAFLTTFTTGATLTKTVSDNGATHIKEHVDELNVENISAMSLSATMDDSEQYHAGLAFKVDKGRLFTGDGINESFFDQHEHIVVSPSHKGNVRYSMTIYANARLAISAWLEEVKAKLFRTPSEKTELDKKYKEACRLYPRA